MIITRTPFRISIGGGGTDLPSYYSRYGSMFISAAIDKYMVVSINPSFLGQFHLRYRKTELVPVERIDKIEHPIIREALRLAKVNFPIEIVSLADLPSGSGLGSSGSFTVGLLNAIHSYNRDHISTHDLAEEACKINMDILQTGSGKQDEYIAAFGGISGFEISRDGEVKVKRLRLSPHTVHALEDRLLIFNTQFTRSASPFLKKQTAATDKDNATVVEALHTTKQLAYKIEEALQKGDISHFGELMHEHWMAKRKRDKNTSRGSIDRWYNIALKNGAVGGKLIGAGGGGFLMFYTDDPEKLRTAMEKENLKETRFRFDFEGSKTIYGEYSSI